MSEAVKFESSTITVEMERQPHCIVKMNIIVTPLAAQAAYSKALKRIKQAVSIPGFRKGKAPESLIKSSFAPQIENEWTETFQKTAITEAFALTNVFPHEGAPPVTVLSKQLSMHEPSHLVISFEALPLLPEVKLEDITCAFEPPKEISENDVHERVEEFRRLSAEWMDVEGRGLQEGDYVDLNISDVKNPEIVYCEEQRFIFAKEKMPHWLYEPLAGHVVGDVVEITSQKNPEGDDPENFQPTHCRTEIKAITSARLPDLDEAFAKKFGTSSVEQFHNQIKTSLQALAVIDANEKFANDVENFLVETYPFELPKSFVEKERSDIARSEFERLRNSGEPPEALEAKLHRHLASLDIERDLKKSLLLEKIGRTEKITVTQDEILKAIPDKGLEGVKDYKHLLAKAYHTVLRTKIAAAIREATTT